MFSGNPPRIRTNIMLLRFSIINDDGKKKKKLSTKKILPIKTRSKTFISIKIISMVHKGNA